MEQHHCPALIAGDRSSSNQEQRRAARRSLGGFQELQQPQGDGLRLRAEAGGEAWRGLWQRKGCRSCAERQESRMMCNTHYIEEKLKGLIDINYQVQFVAAQLTC